MKQTLLCAFIILASLASSAQAGRWTIILNNKTLLNTSRESEKANVKHIKAGDFKKGWFRIQFKESDPDTWYRSFLFFDENDNEVLKTDSSSTAKIAVSELERLFTGKKEIHIYSIVAPRDPNIAVRVRRVHLITLRL